MEKIKRVTRAVGNFFDRKQYNHEHVVPNERLLEADILFNWCHEKFGEPGSRWDFYYVRKLWADHTDDWQDTFGFDNEQDYVIFLLKAT